MLSSATDKNYNVGSGTQTSIKELAELILELTGSKLVYSMSQQGQYHYKSNW